MPHRVLLLGASGGIGSRLAPTFTEDTLICHYYSHAVTNSSNPVRADITNDKDIENMVSLVIEKFGGIDVLINAAGISLNGFAHKASPSDWRATIDVNLVGAFNVIRSFLPFLREQRFGRIINISSVVFQHPVLGTSAYSASKAGLVGLTRTIALENASFGITCNCIALGYMDAGLTGSISPTVMEEIVRRIPLGRLGTIGELRRTIDYLVETEYITGQTVSLNGGLIMV